MEKFKFTLLLYLSLALAVVASSNPNNFGSHRRDHVDLGRLLKKRAPVNLLGDQSPALGQQTPSTTSPDAQPTQASSAIVQTTSASLVSAQTSSQVVSTSEFTSPSTTSGDSLLSSVVGGLLSTQSGTTSSTEHITTSPTSSHPSSTPQASAQASKTLASIPTQSILYLTSSTAPTASQTSSTSSSSGMSPTAITVLIVIAASVGAAIIVWTIIRKLKFRPSSDFEGRMQPIDWQPGGSDEDTGFPGQHRPLSHSSSFHSGSAHGSTDDQMRGPIGGQGASTLNLIPDHDFTAGPAHFAPVGGYADLARGPSPQPVMQESLEQAPSINRPIQYDQYGVPLHHGYSGY